MVIIAYYYGKIVTYLISIPLFKNDYFAVNAFVAVFTNKQIFLVSNETVTTTTSMLANLID